MMDGAVHAARLLRPAGWEDIDGLIYGFGDRSATAPPGTWTIAHQVHGTRVIEVDAPASGADPRVPVEADALVLRRPGVVGGVRTADCVPLLLVAPGHLWAAAVHAGWRGTLAGIATAAVERAQSDGIAPRQLRAALGPAIGPCCYEVSAEIGERFAEARLPVLWKSGEGAPPHLDLRAINAVLLERAGVAAPAIQQCGPCTRCARDRYYSFRAEPGQSGRQVSWVGWEARTQLPDR